MSDVVADLDALTFARIPTNGVTLHVARAGPADGPLVLLLHGFPEFWYSWRHQIAPLAAAGWRVWAPDLRGYNLSDRPRGVGAYRLDAVTRDVIGLIDAAGVERAIVIGHDWGAMVAWWAALTAPERVARAAMLNVPHPAVFRRELRTNLAQVRRSWYIFAFQLPGLPERMMRRDEYSFAARSLRAGSARGTFTDADLARYREAWGQPGALSAMINWYRALLRRSPRLPRDPRVRVPALIVWGERDRYLGREMASKSVDLCDDGRLALVPTAGHFVHEEAPAEVTALLLDFCAAERQP